MSSTCPFWPDKKVRETHLLFLVPGTVNGNPLTLNFLKELIREPKKGHKTDYRGYEECVKNKLGDQSTSSCWVLMTRDIIPNSRNKNYEEQEKLVATHAQGSSQPYELPKALEAAIGILIEHVQTGKKLYSVNPSTFTKCQEKVIEGQRPVVIGDFTDEGLVVGYCPADQEERFGVGSSWKL